RRRGEKVDGQAIKEARAGVAKAEASLAAMRGAKSYAEFRAGWSDFLLAGGRVYTKLEQGAKSNNKSAAWFGKQKHERRTDPLLSYIWHARNADEHGLAEITEHTPGGIGIGSTGQTHIKSMAISGRKITHLDATGSPLVVTITPDRVRLMQVIDRGVAYNPPT